MNQEQVPGPNDEQLMEMLFRQLAQGTAGLVLLDGAMAVRNGEIAPEVYAELMMECVKVGDAVHTMTIQELKVFMDTQYKLFDKLCPMKGVKTTSEQRKKML